MKRIVLLASLFLMALPGCNVVQFFKCNPGYSRPNFAALQAEVSRNKQLWISKNVQSYEYTYQGTGFGRYGPFRVTVNAGVVTQIKSVPDPLNPGRELNPPTVLEPFLMEQVVADLERSIAVPGDCATAVFTFDATYGFPKTADFTDQTRNLMDGFGGYRIDDFAVIP